MMRELQPTKRPTLYRPTDGFLSTLGGLTLAQKRAYRKFEPLPEIYHEHMAWALATCRNWVHYGERNQNHGMRKAASLVECMLDDIAMAEAKKRENDRWQFYYRDDVAGPDPVEPFKALILCLAVLNSIQNIERYDPRYQTLIDFIDYQIGVYGRSTRKASAVH